MTSRPDEFSEEMPVRAEDPLAMHDLDKIYDLYDELRSCPVNRSDAQGSFYWLARYKDVRAAAVDFRRFSSGLKGVRLPAHAESGRLPAIEMDPPEHGFWRRLYMEAITPAKLEAMAPRLGEIADSLIDRFAGSGECDLVEEFLGPSRCLGFAK